MKYQFNLKFQSTESAKVVLPHIELLRAIDALLPLPKPGLAGSGESELLTKHRALPHHPLGLIEGFWA